MFGTTLVLLGVVLLMGTLGVLPVFAPFWPLLIVALGGMLLHSGLTARAPEAAVFAGLFLLLGGLFFLLLTTVMSAVELRRVWPVFMSIAGISLIGYARMKTPAGRLPLAVPGFVLLFLSLIFLIFSFDVVDEDFTAFVGTWWPFIFILAGLGLVVTHFIGARRTRTDK